MNWDWNQILKWVFLLSVVSIITNGLVYSNTGEIGVLIGVIFTGVLAVTSGIGALITRKR